MRTQPMTRMSEQGSAAIPEIDSKQLKLLGGSGVARAVHGLTATVRSGLSTILMLGFVTLGACVIPPSLSVDNQDAGVNSPPAILAVRSDDQELPEPGPVLFDRGAGSLNAELLDTDVDDTLFLRIFVDYTVDDPKPARATCTATPTGNSQRTVTCDLRALCGMSDVGRIDLLMSIRVFDREPLEAGHPAFQAMPPGGQTTGWFFQLRCQDPMQ